MKSAKRLGKEVHGQSIISAEEEGGECFDSRKLRVEKQRIL